MSFISLVWQVIDTGALRGGLVSPRIACSGCLFWMSSPHLGMTVESGSMSRRNGRWGMSIDWFLIRAVGNVEVQVQR